MKTTKKFIASVALLCFSFSVDAVDWSKVEAKKISLFYPGQSSLEWILTKSDHGGAKSFRRGKGCRDCHQGEEKDMGNLLVSGKRLEPNPIPGKRGFVDINVKTTYDDSRFYIQLTWPKSDENAMTKVSKDQTRVTFLFDDGTVSAVKRAGCWASCHDDSTNMPSASPGKDRGLYLAKSRTKLTRKGGGENYKPAPALQKLLAEGVFVEYWQAKMNQGMAAVTVDGYILEEPHANELAKVTANAEQKNGAWVLEMSRELTPGLPHTKNIVADKKYSFGLALHEAYSQGRNHLVSFGHSFVLGQGKADLIAIKQ